MDDSYNCILCCNDTRNVDDLFDRYKRERDSILFSLIEEPETIYDKIWSSKGLLSRDSKCMCNGGRNKKYTPYKCPQCINIGRLKDYDNKNEKSFMIETGSNVGTFLMLIELSIGKLYSEVSQKDKNRVANFLFKNDIVLSCGSQRIDDLKFLRSDFFTNNTLISWIVEIIFTEKDLPHSLDLFTSYICGSNGFVLLESPTIGSFQKLKLKASIEKWDSEDVCESICKQLGVYIDVLSEHFFSHGISTLDTLMFSDKKTEYDYKDLNIRSKFTLHIVDHSYSSITYKDIRLYSGSDISDMIMNFSDLTIIIANDMFKITNSSHVMFDHIRHSGVALYSHSFDFYCFIVGLMLDKYFYDSVKSSSKLNDAWSSIWHPDEIAIIENRILSNMNDERADVMELFSGLWLHCNVTKIWLSKM